MTNATDFWKGRSWKWLAETLTKTGQDFDKQSEEIDQLQLDIIGLVRENRELKWWLKEGMKDVDCR